VNKDVYVYIYILLMLNKSLVRSHREYMPIQHGVLTIHRILMH